MCQVLNLDLNEEWEKGKKRELETENRKRENCFFMGKHIWLTGSKIYK